MYTIHWTLKIAHWTPYTYCTPYIAYYTHNIILQTYKCILRNAMWTILWSTIFLLIVCNRHIAAKSIQNNCILVQSTVRLMVSIKCRLYNTSNSFAEFQSQETSWLLVGFERDEGKVSIHRGIERQGINTPFPFTLFYQGWGVLPLSRRQKMFSTGA